MDTKGRKEGRGMNRGGITYILYRYYVYGITDSMDMSLSKLRELVTGKPGVWQSMELQSRTRLSN